MPTPASIRKHPIHPMLVPLPIGLWIFSLVSDLVFLFIDSRPIWADLALYTMAGGVVGAVLAAIPGIIDYASLESPRVKKIATFHMILNLLAVVSYVVNLWLRVQGRVESGIPVLISAATILVIGISGWLGGELVYVHGVGVESDRVTEQHTKEGRKTA